MWPFRRARLPLGRRGENAAARHLRRTGYKILARNERLAGYEIDVIARKRDTIAFVEVKTRRADEPVPPEENVGYTKRRHIRAAAHRYIAAHPDPEMYYRFDIVSVLVPETGKVEVTHFEDAFWDQE